MKLIIRIFLILFMMLASNLNYCLANTVKFKDVSSYKEGSLIIYSVFTSTKNFNEMKNYAKGKKDIGGSKFVYFFDNLKNTPNISKVGMDFDNRYNKYWIGGYFMYSTGKEKFLQYPGRN